MGANESTSEARRLVAAVEQDLPDYKMVSHVGNGAFGNVWKCLKRADPSNSTKYLAVKQIDSTLTNDEHLLNEIGAMRKLRAQCQNFVSLPSFRFDEARPYAYLIMEYCDGGDLEAYLKKHNKPPEGAIQAVFRQFGKAMEVMLQHSVIHRDIKPQNILLCKGDPTAAEVDLFNCTVKLADFGVATMADRAYSLAGTCDYMAPEVIRCLAERQGSYDAKCDMFSVGVVLYQCVTGKLPFARPTMIVGQTTGDLTSLASGQKYETPWKCSTHVRNILDHLLIAAPSKRIGAGARIQENYSIVTMYCIDQFMKHPWFAMRLGQRLTVTPPDRATSQMCQSREDATERLAVADGIHRFSLFLCGDHKVGKTAIIERFIRDIFYDFYGRSSVAQLYRYLSESIQIGKNVVKIEVRTLRRHRVARWDKLAPRHHFRPSHAAIILYDITSQHTFQRYPRWMKIVRGYMGETAPIFLVGCKADLSNKREVYLEDALEVASKEGMIFAAETSAKTASGVTELFTRIASHLVATNAQPAGGVTYRA